MLYLRIEFHSFYFSRLQNWFLLEKISVLQQSCRSSVECKCSVDLGAEFAIVGTGAGGSQEWCSVQY
jgi:hypothetical protein